MTPRLKISVENLYDTFAKYHGNLNMTGSPIYDDVAKWNKFLLSKSLRNLTSEDLSRFSGKVISTWGDTNDLKHFLPRLFELTALLDTPYDIWILYQKLQDGNFQKWDTEDQNAINEFSLALWGNLLSDNSEKAEWEFDDYFATIAHFYPSFNDLTDLWMINNSFSAIKHLSNYIYDEAHTLFREKHIKVNEKSTKNILVFKNWLFSDSLIEKLTKAFYRFEKTELSERIAWVIKILKDEKYSTQQAVLRQQGVTSNCSSAIVRNGIPKG
ncbi:hypothetical protein [Foetidibacter luteolus]|uniref:hypothetical protein n=1 Tax=Foetidibacter luteolus TaxID=2608880 RepID=UPI00129BBC39|nr:hypothetical protein [Foetidibacter luteolus]